jgi:aryl-alcohol dehydrogenase-like predicted oxidoreductase
MEYRRMGRSGLQLSVLSFGSWVTFHKQINDNSADELMGIAYDNGINFFDNAEVYALGESEKMMGRVLKAKIGTELLIPFLPKRSLVGEEKKTNPIKQALAESI